MGNELVIKSNSLVEASYTLTVTEFRLLQMIFADASKYDDTYGFLPTHEFIVHAKDYATTFKVDIDTAYTALKDATDRLFDRYFTYERIYAKPDKIELVHSRWVQKVAYSRSNGHVSIQLTSDVIDMIGKLKTCFTQYKIKQIANLTSIYALRLYELIIQWSSTRKTPIFEISEFREKLGVLDGEYTRMNNFKSRVLEPAINQINKNTDIIVVCKQHKSGRSITGFSFSFGAKRNEIERDPNTRDWVDESSSTVTTLSDIKAMTEKMTSRPKKRKVISQYEAEKLAMPGETWEDLLKRISKDYIVKDLNFNKPR
ncbi:MAG TPA: replication initiation protein RepM [Erysipelothrix sp.]